MVLIRLFFTISLMTSSSMSIDFSFIHKSTQMIREKSLKINEFESNDCNGLLNKSEIDVEVENFIKNYKLSFKKIDKILQNGRKWNKAEKTIKNMKF